MTRYLCLDNALAITGWAIYDDNILFDYGTFKTNATDPIDKRLCKIVDFLDTMYNDFHFNMLFFEDCQQQSNRNVQTYHKLSMVKAIILYWCGATNVSYVCSSPSHWRSILKKDDAALQWGRNRVSQKAAAKQWVKNKFKEDVSEDEADAICLGYAGILENSKPKSAF